MREQAEGFVDTLYFRPNKALLPKESKTLTFVVRKGILNDCHAHALSPRQVLIAASNAYVNLDLPNNALRENILLQTNLEFDKQQLESGDTLSLDGGRLELRIMFQCEPCGRLNKARPDLCRDIKGQRGWLARVVSSGILQTGDELQITKQVYPRLSENWRERVLAIARLLPADHSLSYGKLALLGVAKGSCLSTLATK